MKEQEKNEKGLKKDAGITLVALVVTIIILIILATISIGAVLGEGGLITRAQLAKRYYENSVTKEQEMTNSVMATYANMMAEPPTPIEPEEPPEESLQVANLTKDNYGEYVNYGIDINGDNDITNDWRIFYKGSDNVFLIAADYVPSNCSALTTAIDASHAHMTKYSDENYETYYWANSSDGVYHCNDGYNKTLNQTNGGVAKEQCSFPNLFMSTNYYCSRHVGSNGISGNTNARCASALQCTGNWKSFLDTGSTRASNGSQSCGQYAIGGPTLEMWVASWNQKHGKDSNDEKKQEVYFKGETKSDTYTTGTSQTGYYFGITDSPNTYYYNLNLSTGYDDTLYFPHKGYNNFDLDNDSKNETCYGYWLASPSASNESYLMSVYCSGYVDSNYYSSKDYGVRPVVCLKSGVKLTKDEDESKNGKVVYNLSM